MSGGRKAIKFIAAAAAVLLLGFMQAGFFDNARILGAKPELILCFLAVFSMSITPMEAMLFGLCSGLYFDIVYGRYVGIYALLFMYVCVVTSLICETEPGQKKWLRALILPPLLLIYEMAESLFIRFAAVYIARESALYVYGYKQHFLVRILPGVLYNIIVSAVFFAISLLIAVLARPKPLIKYRRGKDKVIDNA